MEIMETSEVSLIRKWGGSTTDAILDPDCLIFRVPEIEGLIGYRLENTCALVFGDPICSSKDTKSLVHAFHEYCNKDNLKVIYLIISEEFSNWLVENGYCKTLIQYGEELILDPHNDPRKKEGVYASLVRRKSKHAILEGVTINEYSPSDPLMEKEMREVGKQWLHSRKGPQIHFSHVDHTFDYPEGKRWFYAEKNKEIIGVLNLNLLEKHQGWLMNHLMFTKNAPNGLPELLVVSVLEKLAKENCHYVTFGTVPLSHLKEISGLNLFYKYMAAFLYKIANKLYHLNGKKKFWKKFLPESKKAFLAFKDSTIGLKEAMALKKVFNATLTNSQTD